MEYNRKPERKKTEPIVKRDHVVSTKEGICKRLVKEFFADDIQDVKYYLVKEKIIPGIKNLVLDGLEKVFFKDVRSNRSGRSGYDYSQPSYRYYYNGKSGGYDYSQKKDKPKDSENVDCRNIVLAYREDAEALIRRMKQILREDGEITVAQLFDLIDSPSEYVDNNWGWKDERDIGIRRVSTGYLIDVAEPKYLGGV